ncbi:MAG TPA: class IV adenylate cyclase [Anaerolineaceae bacterium]|jgi:adenylate cyclase class 2
MSEDQELEVKFFLKNLSALESRVRAQGASRIYLRTYEINLRFDTAGGTLSKSQKVLRLRQDTAAILTFKGPSQDRQDVTVRQEIEFQVSDFPAARRLLEALDYQVNVIYEKYRTTYDLEGVKITLDEMPYGNFCEIEGPDPQTIRAIADRLELDWSARVMDSYLAMFSCLKDRQKLEFRDLTFTNFEHMPVSPDDLGVRAADRVG